MYGDLENSGFTVRASSGIFCLQTFLDYVPTKGQYFLGFRHHRYQSSTEYRNWRFWVGLRRIVPFLKALEPDFDVVPRLMQSAPTILYMTIYFVNTVWLDKKWVYTYWKCSCCYYSNDIILVGQPSIANSKVEINWYLITSIFMWLAPEGGEAGFLYVSDRKWSCVAMYWKVCKPRKPVVASVAHLETD